MKKINRKAKFRYIIQESIEAGIVLIGGEVKAIKKGSVDLSNSYAKIIDGEVYLLNTHVPIEGKKDYNPSRTRKLLLNKREITSLTTKIKGNKLTLVPTKVYTKRGLIKLEIALARAKKEFQKKETIKQRDIERDVERELRGFKGNDKRV